MPTQIVHIEIPADDTGKAQAFWGSLFGWQFQNYPGPSDYFMTQISDQTGIRPGSVEGLDDASWVLLDYGDLVVHVFLDETRAYYDLERLWADAPRVTWDPGRQDEAVS